MRILTATLTAAAVLSMSVAAQAADAVDVVPEAPEAINTYIPQTGNWAGAYGGVEGSFNWGRFNNSNSQTDRGLGFDLYAGYNWQSDNLVYGLEGDIGYSGRSSTSGGVTSKQGINGSVRGRLGVDMNPFLLYGTGGLAAASHTASSAAGSQTLGLLGWTAGMGAEAQVTEGVTARIEYRYTDFAARNFNLGGATVSSGYDEHAVKVGIGVKF